MTLLLEQLHRTKKTVCAVYRNELDLIVDAMISMRRKDEFKNREEALDQIEEFIIEVLGTDEQTACLILFASNKRNVGIPEDEEAAHDFVEGMYPLCGLASEAMRFDLYELIYEKVKWDLNHTIDAPSLLR